MRHKVEADVAANNIGSFQPLSLAAIKGVSTSDDKPAMVSRQYVCSFCKSDDLQDNAISFRGITACFCCLVLWDRFKQALRVFHMEREAHK